MRRPTAGLLAVAVAASACGGKVVLDVSAGTAGSGGSTSSSSSASGTGGTGGAVFCMVPTPGCPSNDYCSWSDESCGGTDAPGTCAPRPTGCSKELDPTCACDGMVYDNPCEARRAGFDVNVLGGCKPPPGMFACGAHFCAIGAFYCKEVAASTGATSTCQPAPAACGGTASCDCLTSVGMECIGTCLSTMDGGILLACQQN